MADCNYKIKLQDGSEFSFSTDITSREESSVESIKKAILNNTILSNEDLKTIISDIESQTKNVINLSDIKDQIDKNAIGIISIDELIKHYVPKKSDIKDEISILYNNLLKFGINISLNNIIVGNYSNPNSRLNLATYFDYDSGCIFLNINELLSEIDFNIFKAVFDYNIYELLKDSEKVLELLELTKITDIKELFNFLTYTLLEEPSEEYSPIFKYLETNLGITSDFLSNLRAAKSLALIRSINFDKRKKIDALNILDDYLLRIKALLRDGYNSEEIEYGGSDLEQLSELFGTKIQLGDIILLDVDGLLILKDGRLSTEESSNYYWEHNIKNRKKHLHPEGVGYIFYEYKPKTLEVVLLRIDENGVIKAAVRETFSIKDPQLWWQEKKDIEYKDESVSKKTTVKKRIWSDKTEYTGLRSVRIRKRVNTIFNDESVSLEDIPFKSVEEFKKETLDLEGKESKDYKRLKIEFQDKTKFDSSITTLLNVGDCFILNGIRFYIEKDLGDSYILLYLNDDKTQILRGKKLKANINPSTLYINKEQIVTDLTTNPDGTPKDRVLGEYIPITDANRDNWKLLYPGSIIYWKDKDGHTHGNFLIGINRSETHPSFKILEKGIDEKTGKEWVAARTINGTNQIYGIKLSNTQPKKKLLKLATEALNLTDELIKRSDISSIAKFPGDNTSAQTYYDVSIKTPLAYELVRSLNYGDFVLMKDGTIWAVSYLDDKERLVLIKLKEGDKLEYKVLNTFNDIVGIFPKYPVNLQNNQTAYFNSYLIEKKKDLAAWEGNSSFELVPMFLMRPKTLSNGIKILSGTKVFIPKSIEDLGGCVWTHDKTTFLEKHPDYEDVTTEFCMHIKGWTDRSLEDIVKSDDYKEGKISPMYAVRQKAYKIYLNESGDYNVKSTSEIDMENIHLKLTKGMYVKFKTMANLCLRINASAKESFCAQLRWFRIIEHIPNNGYYINYSVYTADGKLQSTTFFVKESFMEDNMIAVKFPRAENAAFRASTRLLATSLKACKLALNLKDDAREKEINRVIDSIITRLNINIRRMSSAQIETKYGKKADALITFEQDGNPILIISNDSKTDVGLLKLHELMHFIFASIRNKNEENYYKILNLVDKLITLEQYKKEYEAKKKAYPDYSEYVIKEELLADYLADKFKLLLLTSYDKTEKDSALGLLRESIKEFFKIDLDSENTENESDINLDDLLKSLSDIIKIVKDPGKHVIEAIDRVFNPYSIQRIFKMNNYIKDLITNGQIKLECN